MRSRSWLTALTLWPVLRATTTGFIGLTLIPSIALADVRLLPQETTLPNTASPVIESPATESAADEDVVYPEVGPRPVDQLNPETVITGLPTGRLKLQITQGNCPSGLQFWHKYRYFEGGAELGVLLESAPVTEGPWLMDADDRNIAFAAALDTDHADCVAISQDEADFYPYYWVELRDGAIRFTVDLSAVGDGITVQAIITDGQVFAGRPYVQWAIAD